MTSVSTRSTGPLWDLVDRIRPIVARNLAPAATAVDVADCLRAIVQEPDLLTPEQSEGDPDDYRQHVLHVEPDGSFSVVALVWLPGQSTAVHDHVCWCVVGVYQGEETEVRYRLSDVGGDARPVPDGRSINTTGDVCGIAPPGDIHQVRNTGTGTAISLHVYGADIGRLGTSIRRCYDVPAERRER